jgi:hypothetical protein
MITLTTSIYEGNYKELDWFLNFSHPLVTNKLLIVNNLNDRRIDGLYSDDCIEEINREFKISTSPKTVGHYYSVHHYAALLKCPTPYLLSVSTDSTYKYNDDFITKGLEALKDPKILAHIAGTSTKVMCDHVWLADVKRLKSIDFNTTFKGDFTPAYGGESFEKRISCYLHNSDNKLSI